MNNALKKKTINDPSCSILLDNQLCFPLYVCAKEFINSYTPFLSEVDLTYTQYVTMMVLWEEKEVVTRHLKERLFLDSGTLTPVLKKLEEKGLITKERSKEDARDLIVTITKKGEELKDKASKIPSQMTTCMPDFKHKKELKIILDEMMEQFESKRNDKKK
ncbi:MAG: MarR family transcriptional regulator [Butyrivibrio sp.]|uniref:MarR family winged helix-turn-helix transcriptional regulator n=1 Tax=Butyrivibrio sp. TaxID=28121 RepID=UPI0025DAC0D2|nr:MarR family transcriptional regulator [Butyrivibrio sp.]MCR5772091.1 MarR family transcriptional regulator [Butyrivibrio sp.]